MKIKFKASYISEPNLIFGNQREEKDPCLGLTYHGPYKDPSESNIPEKIKLGIVGNKLMIDRAGEIIKLISKSIGSQEYNKWLHPNFPGISEDTKFNCSIELSRIWQETITQAEIDSILNIADANERIGSAVDLYLGKIRNTVSEDNPPDVILCCIPKQIEEYCGISKFTRGAKTPKPTPLEKQINNLREHNQSFLTEWAIKIDSQEKHNPRGYDFRNALKGKVMMIKPQRPIQILRESTVDAILTYNKDMKKIRQDPASFAWNLSTALFYKANGKPWRLAKLRQDTCYVGISFYRDKLSFNKDIQTSMAQIFTHDGHGLVLRGTDVYIDDKTKEAHLSESQAKDLLSEALSKYEEKAGRSPSRVVLHKSTLFTTAEMDGFKKAIGNLKRDFVTISKKRGIRFMRKGSYPVLRGTLIVLTDREYILYTSGYIPRLRTYPGHSIPQPLFITHDGDSQINEICEEIIGLTKLNWNTTAFSTYLPITLAFSNRVGQILSEANKDIPLQPHYRFYM